VARLRHRTTTVPPDQATHSPFDAENLRVDAEIDAIICVETWRV